MEQTATPLAEAATDEPASPFPHAPREVAGSGAQELIDFDSVPLRYRQDGLTPRKQREYVEALADCGIAREAAARIGVSEQSVNRARRRADARSFDLACEAAIRIGARRIRSIAFQRAIEGTVKRHYYHGELKSEELVHDNRLLIYLLGRIEHLIEPPEKSEAVAENWQLWMDAMEQGLPAPKLPDPYEEEEEEIESEVVDPCAPRGDEVWQEDDGTWWTNFPPPAGFEGQEESEPRDMFYKRTLTEPERVAADANEDEEWAAQLAVETVRRDRFFGFASDGPEAEVFSPREAETYETSAGARRAAEQRAGGQPPRERPADGSAEPNPIDVTGVARDGMPRIPKIAPGERSTWPRSRDEAALERSRDGVSRDVPEGLSTAHLDRLDAGSR